MVSHLVFYQLGLIVLVWVFLILYGLWPSEPAAARPMLPKPLRPRCKYSKQPKPFPGLTRQPCCTACEQAIADLGPAEQSHARLAGDIRDLLTRTRAELDRAGRESDPLDG